MTPGQLEPGAEVDRYRVLGLLGQGGMAEVYQVEHRDLGTEHALKVLRISAPGLHERLLQEGRIQARLRHPNAVAVTDVVRIQGAPGLIMELVRGPSLDQLLREYTPSPDQADVLARDILAGVAAAHARGLVHRDLKPGNVLIVPEADGLVAKVTDFGLARALGGDLEPSTRTRTGATLGTPAYMAPEQLRSARDADHRADIFSLGAILYELVSGVGAFHGDDLITLYEQTSTAGYRPVRQVAPQVPERMERAIVAALQPNPADRPGSVEALLAIWTAGTASPAGVWEPSHVRLVASAWSATGALADATSIGGPSVGGASLAPPIDAPPVPPVAQPARRRSTGRAPLVVGALALVGGAVFVGAVAGGAALGLLWLPSGTPSTEVHVTAGTSELGSPAEHSEPIVVAPPLESQVAPTSVAPAAPRPVSTSRPAPVARPLSDLGGDEAAPTPVTATVTVTGATGQAFLIDRDHGDRHPVGEVPPGVYHLYVGNDEGSPVRVLELRLAPGATRDVRCRGGFCQ